MRLLVLGGTAWFSRAVAAQAHARGHEVVCAARGRSGDVAKGVRLVTADRDDPGALDGLATEHWDSVVDVTRIPSHARGAVAVLADVTDHWLYVSTGSVYRDHATPHQTADADLLDPPGADVDEADAEHYGELKRACELAVLEAMPDRTMLMRPGLIVGPGDPSGRFAYWLHHATTSPALLVPERADDLVQLIDVRDLASWTVTLAEQQTTGVLDGLAPPTTRAKFVADVLAGVGATPELVWVDQQFLADHDVAMWMGERSIPLWVPVPEYAGFMARDVSVSIAAGLVVRPLADTARDTLDWLRQTPGAKLTGLTDGEHAELLDATRAQPAG